MDLRRVDPAIPGFGDRAWAATNYAVVGGLPAPPNTIWHYPGFPSLLVTYGVSNDYFFSGHTAIAVLAVTEIARMGRRWLTALGVVIVLFEIATVLILRAHYTMDVFTGIVTGLYAAHLAVLISTTARRSKTGKTTLAQNT
jgi:hypothetical protein